LEAQIRVKFHKASGTEDPPQNRANHADIELPRGEGVARELNLKVFVERKGSVNEIVQ
jgi:hypothetical protein